MPLFALLLIATYMPPEQLASCTYPDTVEQNHHQGLADLYAIGIAVWTLLIETDPSTGILARAHF